MNKVLAKRLRDARKERGFSQRSLADRIGVGQSSISMIEQGKVEQPDHIIELARALGKKPEWLLGIETQAVAAPPRAIVTTEGNHGIAEGEIPQVDAYLGAGLAAEADQHVVEITAGHLVVGAPVIDTWKLPPAVLRKLVRRDASDLMFVESLGDSMSPTLSDGDIALIDRSHRIPSPPGIYALWDGFGQVIKRLEVVPNTDPVTVKIISDNEHHSAYERTLDEVSIIGRYVGRFTTN